LAKNEHAVALGRLGGSKSSPAKQASSQRNATKPRPGGKRYQWLHHLELGTVLVRHVDGDSWQILHPPYDRLARLWLRRNS